MAAMEEEAVDAAAAVAEVVDDEGGSGGEDAGPEARSGLRLAISYLCLAHGKRFGTKRAHCTRRMQVGEKRKTRSDATADAEAAPAKKVSKMQPLKLGPKTFNTPDELYRYFSRLLMEQTLDQNINEVRLHCFIQCLMY